MKKNIILAGVGGQGILSIAAVLDLAALENGLNIKQAEVHGMSQRGGAVQSHLRISSEKIYSDLIPKGQADLILSVEPLEALRYIPYLKQGGQVVSSTNPFINIPNYPDMQLILNELALIGRPVLISAETLAKEAGSLKTTNMVMLGAASGFTGLAQTSFEKAIATIFQRKGERIIDMNIRAFQMGVSASGEVILQVGTN